MKNYEHILRQSLKCITLVFITYSTGIKKNFQMYAEYE
jgi:hypothetical protein